MKNAALLFLSIFLAGCVSSPPAERAATMHPVPVVYAYATTEGACYMRYLQQAPLDRICVQGENVRYSASPDGSQPNYLPMPRHVDSLFNSIAVERVLRHQRSLKSRDTADRPVD